MSASNEQCDLCGGELTRRRITYAILYQGRPVVIENVPATVCEQCGEETFSPEVVEMLQKSAWGERKPKRRIFTPVYDLASYEGSNW